MLGRMASKKELEDKQIGELWRRFRPASRQGYGGRSYLIVIRKLVVELAWNIPYGSWNDRLTHPLRKFGITKKEWEDDAE